MHRPCLSRVLRALPLACAFVLLATAPRPASAQETVPAPEPRPSPTAIASTMLGGDTYVKVTYSSPRMRDRVIFGELVPYGELWRTGANETTELTTTGDLSLAGREVDAGTYAVFTIPNEDRWTIVLNGVLGQWGSYNYDEAQDVLRFDVPSTTMDRRYEAFTIAFEEPEEGQEGPTHLVLMWDRTKVAIPVAAR